MGLDSVELVLATEEEFQIAISDEEASHCTTPDMLTELVYSKLRKSTHDNCPSKHGFYVVRRALIDQFALPRERVRPESELEDLIDRKNRKESWEVLLRRISDGKTIYAPLERPRWIVSLIYLSSLVTLAAALFETESASLSLIVSCLLGVTLYSVASLFKIEFPRDYRRVRDLVRIVGTLDASVWNREDVYFRVRKLVSEQLGVKECDIHPNSHFVKDLGMG